MAVNNVLIANQSYLIDRDFLAKLDRVRNKIIYAKIIALTIDEDPIEEIQGRVTQGNVTIDGKSCVRRTCSLSLVANELNIHEYYWSFNTKFQFLIGVENNIEPKYPNIIWFKMGTYIISSFNTSQAVNSYTISIQGKDKMCMLNGDIGGIITPLTWDFGNIEEIQKDGSKIITKYLIKNIITEAVHEHAREPFQNIIVNDLDDLALELLEYRGDKTMYLLYSLDKDMITNFYIPANEDDTIQQYAPNLRAQQSNITTFKQVHFDPRVSAFKLDTETEGYTKFYAVDGNGQALPSPSSIAYYSMIKVEYGETIGYRLTDLTYPGDLISNVGESVTAMLDKIVSMLGNYEYFYNLDGQFVFQRKAVYYEASWNNIVKKRDAEYKQVQSGAVYEDDKMYFIKDGTIMREYYNHTDDEWLKWTSQGLMYYIVDYDNYVDNSMSQERWTYNFNDDVLVTSFSNNPNILNLKNDYSIWGVRKGVTGADIPIHLRYAIDVKPVYYKTFDGVIYATGAGYEEITGVIKDKQNQIAYREAIIQNRLNEYMENLKETYKKTPVPSFLNADDWWNLLDWAEFYKECTGAYPNKQLYQYGTTGFQSTIVFPNGTRQQFRNQLIIDLDINGNPYTGPAKESPMARPWSSWSPFQHGFNGCFHTYTQFIYLNTDGTDPPRQLRSFIYKPEIPEDTTYVADIQGLLDEIAILQEEIEILEVELAEVHNLDWRELIYQMALDYRKHNHDEDYHQKIIENNIRPDGSSYYPKGYTGYEPYYIDLEGFWRQLYDPEYKYTPQVAYVTKSGLQEHFQDYYVWENVQDLNIAQIYEGNNNNNNVKYYYYKRGNEDISFADDLYYKDYLGRFIKINSPIDKINEQLEKYPDYYWYLRQCKEDEEYSNERNYYTLTTDDYDTTNHWAKQVLIDPAGLNFWFDFLDGDSAFDKYAVHTIGDRPKAENDANVKAIYFRDTPEVIFIDSMTNVATIAYEQEQRPGYEYVRLPDYLINLFSVSRQGKSAMDKLDTFLYNYASCTESITINSLPIYYLEPNTRIFVDDHNSNLHGEYLIERMTIPLAITGTMSITATKAIERLY